MKFQVNRTEQGRKFAFRTLWGASRNDAGNYWWVIKQITPLQLVDMSEDNVPGPQISLLFIFRKISVQPCQPWLSFDIRPYTSCLKEKFTENANGENYLWKFRFFPSNPYSETRSSVPRWNKIWSWLLQRSFSMPHSQASFVLSPEVEGTPWPEW